MSAPVSTIERVLDGRIPPSEAGTYYPVPFEMPPGVVRLDVAYDYSDAIGSDPHLTGGNTIDIGIFDQRGADFLTAGFRGWSGSARRAFFIAPEAATPGYLAGPLAPGTWHILLGLYKIAPDGCRYRVTLRFALDPGAAASAIEPPRLTVENSPAVLAAREDSWYRGEMHCHTVHSDGDAQVTELIEVATDLGLDFLAITDHNSLSHLQAQVALGPQPLVLIPGFEVTTYKGHWNVWGASEWIDFRTLTTEALNAAIDLARRRGYLVSCNHPRPYGPPWELADSRGYQCVEVWNGPWQLFNSDALAFWEARLRAGERLVAVGGSDAHRLHSGADEIAHIGTPTLWIHCPGEPTARALLDALRAGHACISAAPDGPRAVLTCGDAMMGDAVRRPADGRLTVTVDVARGDGLTLELHTAAGCAERIPIAGDEARHEVTLDVSQTPYVRAQLVQAEGKISDMRALTNPVYLD